eukprot:tig00021493_g21864.t1
MRDQETRPAARPDLDIIYSARSPPAAFFPVMDRGSPLLEDDVEFIEAEGAWQLGPARDEDSRSVAASGSWEWLSVPETYSLGDFPPSDDEVEAEVGVAAEEQLQLAAGAQGAALVVAGGAGEVQAASRSGARLDGNSVVWENERMQVAFRVKNLPPAAPAPEAEPEGADEEPRGLRCLVDDGPAQRRPAAGRPPPPTAPPTPPRRPRGAGPGGGVGGGGGAAGGMLYTFFHACL